MRDLLSRAGEAYDDLTDRAEASGLLSVLLAVAGYATAFYLIVGDEVTLWLVLLAAVWPGRATVRAAGHVTRWRESRRSPHRRAPRPLEEVTLIPPPIPEPPPPPSFVPRRP